MRRQPPPLLAIAIVLVLAVSAVQYWQYRSASADQKFSHHPDQELIEMAALTTYPNNPEIPAAINAEIERRGLTDSLEAFKERRRVREQQAQAVADDSWSPRPVNHLVEYEWATIRFTDMGQMRLEGFRRNPPSRPAGVKMVADSLIGEIGPETEVFVNGRRDRYVNGTFERLVPLVALGRFGQKLRLRIQYGANGFTYRRLEVEPQYDVAPCPAGGLPKGEWSGGVSGPGQLFYVEADGTVHQAVGIEIGEPKRLSACTRGLAKVPNLVGLMNVTFYHDQKTGLVTDIGN